MSSGEVLSSQPPADAAEVRHADTGQPVGWVWQEVIVKGDTPHQHWRFATASEFDGVVMNPYVSPYGFMTRERALWRLASVQCLPQDSLRVAED